MTSNGWLQIALFGVIVIAITRPFGGYMTRVFGGERTFLSPVLGPVERLTYWCCGVDETEEQSWRVYAVSMLLFGVAGFVTLYALQRLQWYLPFNPQGQPGVEQVLAFNTSVSFVTNTNWQSYVPETTMGSSSRWRASRFIISSRARRGSRWRLPLFSASPGARRAASAISGSI